MEEIKKRLSAYTKRTIELTFLEEMIRPYVHTYEEFADKILQLENEKVIEMVKSKGRTSRTPSLAYQYRINRSILAKNFHEQLQIYRNQLHPAICLDAFFRKDSRDFERDLPYIIKIDTYIKEHGFPSASVPAPERSFELVEDEKWIVEKGGKELLERIGLLDKLAIIPVSEPLMFAVNPNRFFFFDSEY